MIEDVLYSLLKNDATVAGLVGDKIYPYMADENISLPYIVYEETGNEPTNTKQGISDLDTISVNVESYAGSVLDLNTLRAAVRLKLERFKGIVGTKNIDTITFRGESNGYSLEDRIYLNIQQFTIRYKL